MCGPLVSGLLSFAVGAAQTVVQFAAQAEESRKTAEAARAAFEDDQVQISRRQMQEQEALAQKSKLQDIDEAERSAEVVASAAAGGVSGVSLDNLLADVSRSAARNRAIEADNTKMVVAQLQQEKKGSQARNQSRINSAPKPNPLSLVAGIGGAALSGINTRNKMMV